MNHQELETLAFSHSDSAVHAAHYHISANSYCSRGNLETITWDLPGMCTSRASKESFRPMTHTNPKADNVLSGSSFVAEAMVARI